MRFLALSLLLPLAVARASRQNNNTEGTGLFALDHTPTLDNSTEHEHSLGVTPLAPVSSNEQFSQPWATPLVNDCPKLCGVVGPDAQNWTHLHHLSDLVRCKAPLLFDFNVQSTVVETFRACAVTAPQPESPDKRSVGMSPHSQPSIFDLKRDDQPEKGNVAPSGACGATEQVLELQFSAGPGDALRSVPNAEQALEILGSYLDDSARCGHTLLFSKFADTIAGMYVSADVQAKSATALASGMFKSNIQNGSRVMQSCDANGENPFRIGLFVVEKQADFKLAHKAVKLWSSGNCVTDPAGSTKSATEVGILDTAPSSPTPSNFTAGVSRVSARGDCRAIQVHEGDSCAALASRCEIRGKDFLKYNPKSNLCPGLMPKQWVCCSSGDLPDMTPQPQADGTCATHRIEAKDGCWAIADNAGIKVEDIENYNSKTWGWAGCDRLQPGQIICLSKGNTPMPNQLEDASCGPQKVGTRKPSGSFDGFDLAKLNPCPLKTCCSGWGHCGTTDEFCIESPADTGAPGAFKAGTNGCISNCGTDIVNNDHAPAEFRRVGYFQGYNQARACLRMDATELEDISMQTLTHVHFAFAGLTADFDVQVADDIQPQFKQFLKAQTAKKKIISIGGWAQSTDADTYQRYRDAVKPANRDTFARNVLRFLDDHPDLEGVDFDWEYPGASDQGNPASDPVDAMYYLRFLTVMREKLGTGKRSLSVALPASFWYLKPFPVEQMAKVLDYFIYMTYDLHGQWDYGNKFANPGCPTGNCLRSHVNITETRNALVMLTKAGVPAEKVVVGIASYGRSFRMKDPSCTGASCLFTGSRTTSDAEAGLCTDTGGYISNAELDEIYLLTQQGAEGYSAKQWHDHETNSDIMTYGTQGNGMTDWVAYMSELTKETRTDWIKDMNFGGTSDWAIDLGQWFRGTEEDSLVHATGHGDHLECDSGMFPSSLEELEEDLSYIEPQCRNMALMHVLLQDLDVAIEEYEKVSKDKDYQDRMWWYADWLKDSIDPKLEEFMQLGVGEGLEYMDCKWDSTKSSGEGPCTEVKLRYDIGPNAGTRIVHFSMRNETGFYDALANKAGIDRDWIYWEEQDAVHDYCPPCLNLPTNCGPMCQNNAYMRFNFPKRKRNKDDIAIPDPKLVVDAAIPSTEDFLFTMMGSYTSLRMDQLDADAADAAVAYSMPILMLQDATTSIKEILQIGQEHKAAHTRDLVLEVLNIVFAAIPFAGAAASSLGGAARIAQAALIVGELGSDALAVIDLVDDPRSAPLAILGMIVGAAGLRGGRPPRQAFRDAAEIRRKLGGSLPEAFSAEVRRRDAIVQKVAKACTIP